MRTLRAEEGKIFAYKDEEDNEIRLGNELVLGKEDNGSRYYQIDDSDKNEEIDEKVQDK